MEKGKIIFMNGVSSSGKTTLAKTLQERLNEPYFWIAADTFIDMLPEKYNNPNKPGAMSVCLKAIAMDITVDTHANSTEECADSIIELLNCPDKFSAFKTLWAQR